MRVAPTDRPVKEVLSAPFSVWLRGGGTRSQRASLAQCTVHARLGKATTLGCSAEAGEDHQPTANTRRKVPRNSATMFLGSMSPAIV